MGFRSRRHSNLPVLSADRQTLAGKDMSRANSFIRNLVILLGILGLGVGIWALGSRIWVLGAGGGVSQDEAMVKAKGLLIPHHLLAKALIHQGLAAYEPEAFAPEVLFLLVPNHAEAGDAAVVMEERAFEGCGVHWQVPEEMVRYDDAIVAVEHAVVEIKPLIQPYFEQAEIVPMMVSNRVYLPELERLAGVIEACEADFGVVASIDFSHYLTSGEAEKRDVETLRVIRERDYPTLLRLGNDHVDAPVALTVFLQVMDAAGAAGMDLIAQTNSGELSGDRNASVTSYLVGLFK